MYVGKILDKTIRLYNKDYEALKKKWHPSNVETIHKKNYISGRCTLCDKFYSFPLCPDCPFSVFFEPFNIGCVAVLRTVVKTADIIIGNRVTLFRARKSTVKRWMQQIQDILNTFEKVSK